MLSRLLPLFLVLVLAPCLFAGEPPCPPPLLEKPICNKQVLLVPHQEPTTLPKLSLRPVEVCRIQGGPVLTFVKKQCVVMVTEMKECEVEQKVVTMVSKPVTVKDPITGKCCTEMQSCAVEKIIKVKIAKPVLVPKVIVIKVPVLKEGPELIVQKYVLDHTTVPAVKTTYSTVTTVGVCKVPKVVPVLPPPPPPAPCLNCKPH